MCLLSPVSQDPLRLKLEMHRVLQAVSRRQVLTLFSRLNPWALQLPVVVTLAVLDYLVNLLVCNSDLVNDFL